MISGLGSMNAQKFANGYVLDSLIAAGAVDTVTIYLGAGHWGTSAQAQIFRDFGSLEVYCRTDSLSGSTAATATLQYSYDEGNTIWYTESTLMTLNGAAAQNTQYTDNSFTARCARVQVICASTTQTDKVRVGWCFKKRDQ